MQKESLYSDFFSLARTVEELDLLCAEIDQLLESLFSADGRLFDRVCDSQIRVPTAREIRRLLVGGFPDKRELLISLKKEIAGVSRLKLTLAFAPDSIFIDALSGWARQNIAAKVVLEISVDPQIIGGALVSWQGKYGDFSLRKKFEENVRF